MSKRRTTVSHKDLQNPVVELELAVEEIVNLMRSLRFNEEMPPSIKSELDAFGTKLIQKSPTHRVPKGS